MAQNPPLDRLSLFGRERKQCDDDIWKRPVFHLTRANGSLLTMFEEVCRKLWVDVMAQSSR